MTCRLQDNRIVCRCNIHGANANLHYINANASKDAFVQLKRLAVAEPYLHAGNLYSSRKLSNITHRNRSINSNRYGVNELINVANFQFFSSVTINIVPEQAR